MDARAAVVSQEDEQFISTGGDERARGESDRTQFTGQTLQTGALSVPICKNMMHSTQCLVCHMPADCRSRNPPPALPLLHTPCAPMVVGPHR